MRIRLALKAAMAGLLVAGMMVVPGGPASATGENSQATALQVIASGGGGSRPFIQALCPGSPSSSGPANQTVGAVSVSGASANCNATSSSSSGSAAAVGSVRFGAWSSSCAVGTGTTSGSVTVAGGLAPGIPDGTVVTAANTVVPGSSSVSITLNEIILGPTSVTRNAIHIRTSTGSETVIGQVVCFRNANTTLSISKVGPPGAFPNQAFDFTITVTNTGTSPATGVTVVDTLPTNGTFVSSSPSGTPAAPAPGGTYTVSVPDIPVGGSRTVTIRWKAPTDTSTVTNSATASASNAPSVGPAGASVTVGTSAACNPCGAAAAGTGLRNRDQGTITIAGIPTGAVVGRAVLLWGVLYSGPAPANTITFAGNRVTADVAATVSGSLCWGDTNTIGYAADVTGFVTGNGAYVVSDPPRGITRVDADPAGVLPYTDGATLVVFYNGGGAHDQVLSDFSYDTDTDADNAINRDFAGIHSTGGPASLILAGPDGQNNGGETFTLTGAGTITLTNTWDGSDPQIGPSFPIGNLWDTDTYSVTSILPAGQTTLALRHTITGDCIGVGAAVLRVAQ